MTLTLTEDETRAKAIELLDYMDANRMDVWILSGTVSGVLDADLVEKVLNEELWKRSLEVKNYWYDPCGICGNPGAGSHNHGR